MTSSSQTKPLNDVFAAPLRDHAAQRAATDPAFRSLPDAFANRNRLHQYFLYTFVPRNLAWAFKPNNKAGSSSVLAFLFALEFGQPLSAEIANPFEQDTITHRLAEARLLARLPEHPDVSDAQAALGQCLRLTTVRHPASRALSGYFYICRAQQAGSEAFARHRLRMTALVGFDWARHIGTPDGFVRFLDWVAAEDALGGWMADAHFRPQTTNIRPEILRPDIIGRTEDLGSFYTEVCARLGRELPDSAMQPRNRQPKTDPTPFFTPEARARIASIFAADFAAFGYEPDRIEGVA